LEIVLPDLAGLDLPDRVFAKLGPKSWRDGQSVCFELTTLERRLARLTRPQMLLAGAITTAGAPLRLYLSEPRDMSAISEYRMLVTGGRASRRSACLRGLEARPKALAEFAQTACTGIIGPLVLDIACLPDGSLRLVDINPTGSTRPETAPDTVITWGRHAA
jgi:hypothetical protein